MKRRLIGLVLSGMLHAAVILAVVALVRFTAEPDSLRRSRSRSGSGGGGRLRSPSRRGRCAVPRLGARRRWLSRQARPGAFGPRVTRRNRAGAASRGRAARPSGIAAARAGPRGGRAPAFRRATARPDGGDAGAALTDRRGHALGFGGGRERGGLRSDHGRGCRRRRQRRTGELGKRSGRREPQRRRRWPGRLRRALRSARWRRAGARGSRQRGRRSRRGRLRRLLRHAAAAAVRVADVPGGGTAP